MALLFQLSNFSSAIFECVSENVCFCIEILHVTKIGSGTRCRMCLCTQYQLMVYTSFSNASVPFASASRNIALAQSAPF